MTPVQRSLAEVVVCALQRIRSLGVTTEQRRDLVEYLKSL
jgi:hypothetical protein